MRIYVLEAIRKDGTMLVESSDNPDMARALFKSIIEANKYHVSERDLNIAFALENPPSHWEGLYPKKDGFRIVRWNSYNRYRQLDVYTKEIDLDAVEA